MSVVGNNSEKLLVNLSLCYIIIKYWNQSLLIDFSMYLFIYLLKLFIQKLRCASSVKISEACTYGWNWFGDKS